MSIISIKNLSFSYRKKEVLKNINIKIEREEITGIIGPNGCGKSTLAKNIIKYLTGKYEDFKIDNKNLKDLHSKDLSKLISYIPQKTNLISGVSVTDFILLGRYPTLKNSWDFYSKKDYEVVEDNIKLLKIESLKDRNVESLSGGELQKVLLAKALSQEAKILLLDEPTSALDLNNAVEFMKILKYIVIQKNITPIIIIHDLNLASLFCDKLIILKEGQFIAKGNPNEIITEENIKKVYDLECKVYYNEDDKPYIIPIT